MRGIRPIEHFGIGKGLRLRFVLLGVLFIAIGCTNKRTYKQLDLKVESPSTQYSDSLDLYLYGATRISRYPVNPGKSLVVDYKRDTVDLFLIRDRRNGRILLPIVPDTTDLRVRIGKDLEIKGLRKGNKLSEWYSLNALDTVPEELCTLIDSEGRSTLGFLLALASQQAHPEDERLSRLSSEMAMRNDEAMKALGVYDLYNPIPVQFAYRFGTKSKPKGFKEVIKKDTMMVVSVLPEGKVSARDTTFLLSLDTLAQMRYYILPGSDSIPGSWTKVWKKGEKKNLLTVDTALEATKVVSEMNLRRLPYYFIVDSLQVITYQTNQRDSLLRFLEERYHKKAKKPKKK